MKRSVLAATTVGALAAGAVAASQAGALASPAPHATPGAAVARSASGTHGLGLDLAASRARTPVAAPRDHGAMAFPRMRAGAVPAAADLSQYALPAGDQGQVGSCVTWATGYTGYGVLMNEQKISGAPMAPMFIYAQISQGSDQGTFAAKALPMMVEQGIDTKAHYSHGDFDYTSQPNESERANAAKYKLSGFQELPTSGQAAKDAIMAAIAGGSPVPFGIELHQNFNDMDAQTAASYTYQPSGGVVGGHEMTIIGYNDKGVKVMNSWGGSWGDRGTFTMPWSFLDTGDVTEIHSMGKLAGGNDPGPAPTPNPTSDPTASPTSSPTPNPYPTSSPTVDPGPGPQPNPYPTYDPQPYPTYDPQPDPYPTYDPSDPYDPYDPAPWWDTWDWVGYLDHGGDPAKVPAAVVAKIPAARLTAPAARAAVQRMQASRG